MMGETTSPPRPLARPEAPIRPGARLTDHAPPLLLAIAMLAFCAYFASAAVARHEAFASSAQDLGFFDQTIWGSSRGWLLHFTVYDLNLTIPEHQTFLAYHVEPLLILISPIYWLWDDVRAILILQPIVLALAAIPAYRLGRLKLGSAWAGLVIGLLVLLNPTVQAAPVNDFHTLAFAPLLLLAALLAFARRHWLELAGWCGLAILIKEQISLLVAMIGLAALVNGLFHRGPDGRRQAIVGLALLAGGVAWFLVSVTVVIPAAAGNYAAESPFVARYDQYGDGLMGLAQTFLTRPDLVWQVTPKREVADYWLVLLLGGGLLSLLSPLILLAAPELAINSLSSFVAQRAVATHYALPIVAFVVAGAADGGARLAGWLEPRGGHPRRGPHPQDGPGGRPRSGEVTPSAWRRRPSLLWGGRGCGAWAASSPSWPRTATLPLILVPALLLATLNAIDRGFLPGARKHQTYVASPRHAEAADFFARMGPADSVVVQGNLLPHLTHRRWVYPFAYGFTPPPAGRDQPADWVLLDVTAAEDRADGRSLEREVYDNPDYGVAAADNGYLLLRRGARTKALPPGFTRFALANAGEIRQPDQVVSADGHVSYLGASVTWTPDPWGHRGWQATIVSYWRADASLSRDLRFVLANGDDLGRPLLSRPPTAVWLPSSRWPVGQIVRVVHGTLGVNAPVDLTIAALESAPGGQPALRTRLSLLPPRAPGLAGMMDDLLP